MVFKYMYKEQVCAIVKVDYKNEKVEVTNCVEDPYKRPFGKKEHPTFEDFEAFLESRCIPRTRDKLKWALEDIGVDFYNPRAIVEKTGGRMAEDHFWLDIEEDKEAEHCEENDGREL